MIAFSDLATAAYCPRQLYYRRREGDRSTPATVRDRIDLAYRYPELADASDATLVTYRGRCVLESETAPVEALLAVWEAGEYLLAGGGYRLDAGADDARRALLGLVRGVRPG